MQNPFRYFNNSPAIFSFAEDFSQSENLAGKEPQRLAEMKELFLAEAKENKVFPIGAGIWLRIGVVTLSQTEWNLPTIANVDARDFSDLAC